MRQDHARSTQPAIDVLDLSQTSSQHEWVVDVSVEKFPLETSRYEAHEGVGTPFTQIPIVAVRAPAS